MQKIHGYSLNYSLNTTVIQKAHRFLVTFPKNHIQRKFINIHVKYNLNNIIILCLILGLIAMPQAVPKTQLLIKVDAIRNQHPYVSAKSSKMWHLEKKKKVQAALQ